MKILKNGVKNWSNLHKTFSQQVVDVYDLVNETIGSPLENYNDTTKGIQKLIGDAIKSNTPLRALGGSWSLSPVAATNGIVLNTKMLNNLFTITAASVSPQYKGDVKKLCFAQCGTGIWELTAFLKKSNLSLSACGASNGQTIAGAMATGTHGAALAFGAIQDAVVGLHIITSPDKHIFLQRASSPVVSPAFAAKLGATIVADDDAFYSAIVSFGNFGFIHGVMIEAEDQYLLEAYLRRVTYDKAYIHQLETLDFAHPSLPFPGVHPFHFQTLINPYDIGNGAYMTTMYKRPYRTDYLPPKPNGEGIGPGDDAPCFIGKLAGTLPAVVPVLVTKVLGSSLKPYENQCGTLGEIFNNTTLRGKVASAAIGLPNTAAGKVIELLLAVNKKAGPFVGLFAFRFVKKSNATLAFTRFDPTMVLEMDGVLSPETTRFYEAVWNELEKNDIPYTFHWGKMNSLNPTRLKRMYGASLDQFQADRKRIIDPATLRIFTNDTMKLWGID
jgi:FAD/FMN-containing dehydrogenase